MFVQVLFVRCENQYEDNEFISVVEKTTFYVN